MSASIASQSAVSLAVGRLQIAAAGAGDAAASYSYPPGSYTWTCPATGVWRFVLWGGGAGGRNADARGGGSGALYIAERFVSAGQTVAIVAGAAGFVGGDGQASTATFADGEVLAVGGGIVVASGAGGAVTANRAADVVFAGSANNVDGLGTAGGTKGTGGAGAGGGAPGYGTHLGGDGNATNVDNGAELAAGGGTNATAGSPGGPGMVLIYRVGLSG